MDYIILDIEFNGRKFASELPMEVLEIGAVRLDSALQRRDEFSSVIKPIHFPKLNSFIKKKTGIPQESIDEAQGFQKVIQDFTDWLNQSEAFILVTWGGEDIKRIVYDTRMHNLDDSYWLAIKYFDLLKGFLRCKNLKNDVSVEAALLELNLTSEGSAHRALDDARMTADIFRSIFEGLNFELSQHFKDVYTNAKERKMVKNAIRAMSAKKIAPNWGFLLENKWINEVTLEDTRKLAELEEYFAEQIKKAQ